LFAEEFEMKVFIKSLSKKHFSCVDIQRISFYSSYYSGGNGRGGHRGVAKFLMEITPFHLYSNYDNCLSLLREYCDPSRSATGMGILFK